MTQAEYIRPHSDPSRSHMLDVPSDSGPAVLTFLHAGRSSWPGEDSGPAVATERGHGHPVYHAVLYTSGRNTMVHDGRTHDCMRGTMVLTDPGCVHEYRPQSPGGASFVEITFDLRCGGKSVTVPWKHILAHWLGADAFRASWPVNIPPPHLEHLESLMDRVVAALGGDGAFTEAAAALAMGRFVLGLGEYFAQDGLSGDAGGRDGLERAKLHLDRNFAGPIAVPALAAIACLSEGAFIRSFSSRYGTTPMTYRKRLRITAAKHLLAVSGRSIGEIAVSVGYGDIYAFSRTFKSEVGKTASQWRRDQEPTDRQPSSGGSAE